MSRKTNRILFVYKDLDSYNLNKCGVYKMTFDNGYYYIGSTKHFRKRFFCYRMSFNGSCKMDSKTIERCVFESAIATFELIELCENPIEAKTKEGVLIRKYFGDKLLINRPFSNKGIKWTKEESDKTKNKLIILHKNGLGHKFWLHRKRD